MQRIEREDIKIMYELIQAGARSYYIDSPTKIGIYRLNDTDVCLIDSGNDKDAGRRIRQILDTKGWRLKAILNTHSNADHIGGNHYLQKQTGCKIFAGGIEACFSRYPILSPSFVYGGYPSSDMRHKFLLAQESVVSDFQDPDFPREIEVIPLPGHFFNMAGFRTPDNVVYLADCLSSKATLDKYGITFIYDVEAYLKTLDHVEAMEAPLFVPSHAEAVSDIRELVRLNRDKVHEITEKLLEYCEKPAAFEDILRHMFIHYKLSMSFEQYALVGSTIRSYLSSLRDSGKLSVSFTDNRMLWQKNIAADCPKSLHRKKD